MLPAEGGRWRIHRLRTRSRGHRPPCPDAPRRRQGRPAAALHPIRRKKSPHSQTNEEVRTYTHTSGLRRTALRRLARGLRRQRRSRRKKIYGRQAPRVNYLARSHSVPLTRRGRFLTYLTTNACRCGRLTFGCPTLPAKGYISHRIIPHFCHVIKQRREGSSAHIGENACRQFRLRRRIRLTLAGIWT